jgi:spore coat polysaccharide biosynthesis protein SpsF
MGSARLPGKVLADLAGKPMLVRILERLKRCHQIDRIVVATTHLPEDDHISDCALNHGVGVFRGAVDDVVSRVYAAVQASGWVDFVLHATGDNPLIEPEMADQLTLAAKKSSYDFTFMTGIPIGSGVDIYRAGALLRIERDSSLPTHREHLNSWLFDNKNLFNICATAAPKRWMAPEVRLTVDYPEDMRLVSELYARLGKNENIFGLETVLDTLRSDPELLRINSHIGQQYVSTEASKMRRGTA